MPMTFKAESDALGHGLTNRVVSDCGRVEIGVFRVMYGYRVRAGYVDSLGCELDWCAGADMKDLWYLFNVALSILSQRDSGPACFDGIPRFSQVKPYYNDAEFVAELVRLMPIKKEEPAVLEHQKGNLHGTNN